MNVCCSARRRMLPRDVLAGIALLATLLPATPSAAGKDKGQQPDAVIRDLAKGKAVLGVSLAQPRSAMRQQAWDLGPHSAVRFAGDTLLVRFDVDLGPYQLPPVTRLNVYFAGEKPLAAVLTSEIASDYKVCARGENRDWARTPLAFEATPVEFAGWSSTFGCLYATAHTDVYVAVPRDWRPELRAYLSGVHVLRILDAAAWSAGVLGEWTPWSDVKPQAEAAVAAGDWERLAALLGAREMPILGAVVDAYEALSAGSPDGHFTALRRQAEAAGEWPARVSALLAVRAQWRHWSRTQAIMAGARGAARRALDLARIRRQLEQVADLALPVAHSSLGAYELLRAAALARTFGDTLDPALAQAWLDRYRPDVRNVAEISRGRQDLTKFDDGVQGGLLSKFGARWKNEPGHGHPMELELGPMDMSGVVRRELDYKSRSGAWVAASPQQLAEQARVDALVSGRNRAPARLREIERELEALDNTAVGRQVLGSDPGVKQYRTVDASGRTYVTEVSAGRRSVYLTGVREDLARRNQRQAELKSEREQLQSLLRGVPPANVVVGGKVWNSQAGGETVTPLIAYQGVARRDVVLRGAGFESRVTQQGQVYSSYPAGNTPSLEAVRQQAQLAFDTGTSWGHGTSSLHAAYTTAVRRSFGRILEHVGSQRTEEPADVVQADIDWGLMLLGAGRFPSAELYDFLILAQLPGDDPTSP